MKQRPEYVVAVSVVVLVHDFLIQEHWYTSLLGERSGESSLADLVGDVDARPSDPLRVHVLDAEEGADEAAGADLQGPLVLAAAIGGDGEAVGDDEEALLHPAEAEAAPASSMLAGEAAPGENGDRAPKSATEVAAEEGSAESVSMASGEPAPTAADDAKGWRRPHSPRSMRSSGEEE